MLSETSWPIAEKFETRLAILEPLRVDDAPEVAAALDDPELHTFIGGQPASADELRSRFEMQVAGHSPDGSQGWLNWVVRDTTSRAVIGTVQATLSRAGEHVVAEVAWTVASHWQGQGRAKDAAGAMVTWLWNHGVDEVVAHIHPEHAASNGVARSLGLDPTEVFVDGERRWERTR